MVLAELGGSIARALKRMSDSTVVDEAAFAACLNEISRALLQADVRFASVKDLQANVRTTVNLASLPAGANKRHVITQAVVAELCRMLDPGTPPPFSPTKSKGTTTRPSVVMLVGLQGSGKTTTCAKYAAHHRRKGFSPALVCADTFRAGAFDQLKQNAAKANIPFYGSYAETDPVKVAVDGVETFLRSEQRHDLIIVDTSGRHRQEAALLEEMRQVAEAVRPDLVILVMDASIGQAAFDQARAFKESVPVGAVIVTKMDGHAKGGGALSAVAATKAPVIFIGTGEHVGEFEPFDPKPFVSRLLGMGDLSGLVNKIKDAMPDQQQNTNPEEMVQKLMTGGAFTLRMMYDMFQNLREMGPLGQLFSMLPGGFGGELMAKGREKEGQAKIKRYMTIMDSMTAAELDSTDPKMMNESRIVRIARGSGRQVKDVKEMLEEHKRMAKMMKKMPKMMPNLNNNRRCDSSSVSKIISSLPQNVLQQLGGAGALQNVIKQMKGAK
ncbi:hypothetical protein PR202_gb12310 [Eleusine coracana subsp. coracana]|uniref:Signal recognition particle 54 kDa protein n=1 Tax=Eleusine coracana subsp. coracana TaxID=191504 RepID=A0AAV5EPR8_ELECO|nr:hypothetical protein QOZ80_7BG0587290 [Eleusine coracana subsp. coracana]GJN24561.1 hypothetical protein PR202_gb12310 [Eleusine coracana subsp. coracana]